MPCADVADGYGDQLVEVGHRQPVDELEDLGIAPNHAVVRVMADHVRNLGRDRIEHRQATQLGGKTNAPGDVDARGQPESQ